jgi:hypothetical protein
MNVNVISQLRSLGHDGYFKSREIDEGCYFDLWSCRIIRGRHLSKIEPSEKQDLSRATKFHRDGQCVGRGLPDRGTTQIWNSLDQLVWRKPSSREKIEIDRGAVAELERDGSAAMEREFFRRM